MIIGPDALENFGGNIVRRHELPELTEAVFCKEPYYYSLSRWHEGVHDISGLASFCVLVLDLKPEAKICVGDWGVVDSVDHSVQLEGVSSPVQFNVVGGEATVLISGVTTSSASQPPSVNINPIDDLYRVDKPWGYEIWINGEHSDYAFKKIFVRAPHKTSLQYHNFKRETNLLWRGSARLHFSPNQENGQRQKKPADIKSTSLSSVTTVDVHPPTIHRVEASSDILLYETSTPHLDDVVRILDDTNRADGRIASEHNKG